ncbi:galactose-specific lectin nattectin-like isoform X1 [Pristis pectinata]|uniref:galactose-specific lectin nattectin-like isoform X1 n=1 Tax=Pristis pectinata TaxID=685728 RepID=UPI00223D0C2C|nr:galactose-specific lectin nattectin-like isoform X1 [Pristis pectinata]XP_051889654.1 galactose-specific lectin nattectin-like isoform X1 [Pristis pectinata]XP_051889655.1 galactose-specific lectin nattectin-like isoform X1 [Pristis pectinata]
MLVWVLVLTALLVSDVAGRNNSFEVEETQRDLEKRGIFRGPCDESWFYFSELNSCYRFFSQEKTWQEAEDFCNRNTWVGQLPSVTSSEHNRFISYVIHALSGRKAHAWIGLNDRCKEGTYTWIDGSTRKYKNWAKGQPDNYGGLEHCVHIKFNGDDTWNDARCDMKIGFVCSYKLRCG